MSLSALASEHLSNPRNVGPLEGSTHEGVSWAPWLLPGDGPYIKLWLTLDSEGHRITAAAYRANGCPSSIACGSIVAQVLQGRTLEEALRLEAHDINLLLGGLPEGKDYCTEMAVTALRNALLGGESNAQ